jgi:hypothetical protein
MTVVAKPLIQTKYAENTQTVQYTVSGGRVSIDRFVATNNSASAAELSIWLVPNGQDIGGGNRVLYQRSLASKESYSCPEACGQWLENGDRIVTQASASGAITIRVSGREVTG